MSCTSTPLDAQALGKFWLSPKQFSGDRCKVPRVLWLPAGTKHQWPSERGRTRKKIKKDDFKKDPNSVFEGPPEYPGLKTNGGPSASRWQHKSLI